MPALLLLDFDGLVADTERTAMQAWRDCYDRVGARFDPTMPDRMVGDSGGAAVAVADLTAQLGRPLTAAEWQWQRARRAELGDVAAALPGVEETIDEALADGCAVGIVSSGTTGWVERHLDRLDILRRISLLVTGDETPRHKPAPDLYLMALARSGVPAGRAVAVEDSPKGVRAAKAAGLWCAAVPGGPTTTADFSHADVVLPVLRWPDLLVHDREG